MRRESRDKKEGNMKEKSRDEKKERRNGKEGKEDGRVRK